MKEIKKEDKEKEKKALTNKNVKENKRKQNQKKTIFVSNFVKSYLLNPIPH